MRRRLRAGTVMALCLFLGACVAVQGQLAGGRYTTPDGQFSVAIPAVPRLGLEDGGSGSRRYVDFFSGPGYWYPHGQYSVEWIRLDEAPDTARAFLAMAKQFVPAYLAQNYGGTFRLLRASRTRVGAKPAWRFVALGQVEGRAAVWVGTLLDFGDTLVAANLIYPVDAAQVQGPAPAAELYPRADYESFVNSIQRKK